MHQLQPYAEKVILQQKSAANNEKSDVVNNVIIDGPSLAYHVYYVCLSRKGHARNALEAMPSYKELGFAALSWLEQMEQYGMRM